MYSPGTRLVYVISCNFWWLWTHLLGLDFEAAMPHTHAVYNRFAELAADHRHPLC